MNREEISAMVREAVRERIGDDSPGEGSGRPVIDESAKDVITEADLREAHAGVRFIIREDAIITPAARDLIRERTRNQVSRAPLRRRQASHHRRRRGSRRI